MKTVAMNSAIVRFAVEVPPTILERRLRRWTTGLLVCSIAGTIAGLNGLAIAAVTLLEAPGQSSLLSALGAALLAATFPLFFLAAHCLDKIDQTRNAIGREHLEETRNHPETGQNLYESIRYRESSTKIS